MIKTNEERAAVILEAVNAVKLKGINISSDGWGVGWHKSKDRYAISNAKSCCPLGAVLLEFQNSLPRNLDWREWSIETILSASSYWIKGFIAGFDNKIYDRIFDREAFLLGYKMRDDLIPIRK